MASNWRPATIPLTGGLNTSTNPKRLDPGQFSQLDNAVFDGEGAPSKRHGSTSSTVYSIDAGLAPAVDDRIWIQGYGYTDTATLTALNIAATPGGPGETGSVRGLATRDSELLAFDGTYVVSKSPAENSAWVPIPSGIGLAAAPPVNRTVNHIPHLTTSHGGRMGRRVDASSLDVAVGEAVKVVVWADATQTAIYASAYDRETGAAIYTNRNITQIAPGTYADALVTYVPATGGADGFFVIGQASLFTNDFKVQVILESDPATITTTTITTTIYAGGLAVRSFGDKAYFSWVDTSNGFTLTSVDNTSTISTSVLAIGGTPIDDTTGLAFHPDGRMMVAFFQDVAGDAQAYASFFASDLATLSAGPILVSSVGLDFPGSLAITCEWCITQQTNRSARVFWSGLVPGASAQSCYFARIENTTVTRTQDSGCVGVTLAGAAFRTGDTVGVAISVNNVVSPLLAVVYWDNTSVSAVGMVPCAAFGRSTGVPGRLSVLGSMAPEPGQDTYNPQVFTFSYAGFRNNGTADAISSAVLVRLDFGAPIRSAQGGRCTYIAGAIVREYDGRSLHEAGFLEPTQVNLANSNAGSLTPSSTYTYRVYLCHRNAQGEIVRSAAVTRTTTLGAGDDEVLITLPAIYLSTRPGLFWEVYRSQANGTVLTLAQTVNSFTRGQSVVVSDTASDATIAQTAIDPIPAATVNGVGVLDGVAPPACTIIASGKDRLWYAGGELFTGQVAYSRFYDPGDAVTWNEALVVETDRLSDVTGIGFMGDWVVTMSRTKCFYLAGDGPSNLGQGDFFPARLVVSDLGALSPESVLLTPLGLAFQSPQGPRVLGPGGSLLSNQTGHIGSEVDASFDGQTVLGSCVVPEQGHARWLLADGTQMVWDYTVNRWTRWTGYHVTPELGETAGLVYLPGGAVVTAEDSVWTEDTSVFTDAGHSYQWIASLGWISPHGPLSWGRLRRWALEGDARGNCTMKVFIDYDFTLAKRQRYTWRTSTLSTRPDGQTYDHDPAGWGDEASWGAGPVWGGDTADGGAFPTNVRFNRSQATSFRMTFTDDTEPNDTFALRTLSIEFSPKAGLTRAGGRNI